MHMRHVHMHTRVDMGHAVSRAHRVLDLAYLLLTTYYLRLTYLRLTTYLLTTYDLLTYYLRLTYLLLTTHRVLDLAEDQIAHELGALVVVASEAPHDLSSQ